MIALATRRLSHPARDDSNAGWLERRCGWFRLRGHRLRFRGWNGWAGDFSVNDDGERRLTDSQRIKIPSSSHDTRRSMLDFVTGRRSQVAALLLTIVGCLELQFFHPAWGDAR
jgi:hypothetical protein